MKVSQSSFWGRFLRSRATLAGAILLGLVVLASLLGHWISPAGPWEMVGAPFVPPMQEWDTPMGTDTLGRDVLAGLLQGARFSLIVGLVSTFVAVVLGVGIGAASGYMGGFVDKVLMRITEVAQSIPSFALAVVLVAVLQPSAQSIVLSIALVSWPPVARLVRSEFLTLREREFVHAAMLAGISPLRIALCQILPNAMAPIIVMSSLMVASAILIESSLSFLGLGDPNLMSWGYMVGAGRTVLTKAWWLSVFPGIAIVLTVLSFNMLGQGLSDGLNIRLKERTRG